VNKKICIGIPAYNEEDNIPVLYQELVKIFKDFPRYDFEILFIDNCSKDSSQEVIKKLSLSDQRVKAIFNLSNFGTVRSPVHCLISSTADATIMMSCDMQDPPELIPKFIAEWERGERVVVGIKSSSEENFLKYKLRQLYYNLLSKLSEVKLLKQFTGFGLYDKSVVEQIKNSLDPYPYLRGLISELGYVPKTIEFRQPSRLHGKTKNNWFVLFDYALLGFVSHTKAPLRAAILLGGLISGVSLLVAFIYFVLKLLNWDEFKVGMAPLVIGLFFFSSVQLIFLGVIGEYVGAILTNLKRRPLVIEKERINF
jgi:glycosyltransferase involved in cell wall biosynthesis